MFYYVIRNIFCASLITLLFNTFFPKNFEIIGENCCFLFENLSMHEIFTRFFRDVLISVLGCI